MFAHEFRQLLEDGDVDALRKAWFKIAPKMPQPATREQAEIVMHAARTESNTVSFPKRAYSHAWLTERMLPSKLPELLRPSAERLHPVVAPTVGISVNFRSPYLKPAAAEVQGAMEDAVNDCYANGETQVPFVRSRMMEARDRTMKALFGR